jgi:TetR/AcrR family transcriptional regulator, transcriptional repressor for nem operon
MTPSTPSRRRVRAAPVVRPYAESLRAALEQDTTRRKGERTRDRLRVATAEALEARGYTRLRVSDICERAGVSPAAFYQYFPNREAITVEVLSDFMQTTVRPAQPVAPAATRFEALYAANLAWIASTRVNAGLVRCLLQLGDQVPSFRRRAERLNVEWYEHVAGAIVRSARRVDARHDVMRLAVHALGGMMDEVARTMLLAPASRVRRLLRDTAPTDEALAEFLSVLWYRALFGRDPVPLRHAASRVLRSARRGGVR